MSPLSRNCSIPLLCLILLAGCYTYSPVVVKYRVAVPGRDAGGEKPKYLIVKNRKYLAEMLRGPAGRVNNRGVELALAGKFSEAEVLFRDVISDMPGEAAAYNNLGVIYEISGLRDRAFEMYSDACMRDPGNGYFRHNFLTFADSRKN